MRSRSFAGLLLILMLCSCGESASSDVSDAFLERAIVQACQSLVTEYAIARDAPDPDRYAATFADNGRLILPSVEFNGRDAIRERLQQSIGKTRSRHYMSNVQISVDSETEASGIAYAVIYAEEIPAGYSEGQPIPTSGPSAIGEYHDTFRLTSAGWKFKERRFVPAFAQVGN